MEGGSAGLKKENTREGVVRELIDVPARAALTSRKTWLQTKEDNDE